MLTYMDFTLKELISIKMITLTSGVQHAPESAQKNTGTVEYVDETERLDGMKSGRL